MDIIVIKKEIDRVMLEVINQSDNPEIILIYVDTSYDDQSNIVPFFNIFGLKVIDGYDFDKAIEIASEQQDESFIWDVLDECYSSTFEINLSALYPEWPNDDESSDKKVVGIIETVIDEKKQKFDHIQKLYFFHVDSFDFKKIIDK